MGQASAPRKTLVAILTLCPDTGESGEAYDMDVQTPSRPKKDNLSTLARSFKTPNSRTYNSESGEAYEAEEVEACRRDKHPAASNAAANPMHG